MTDVFRVARQAVRGLPYLEKEARRRLSLSTGKVLTTPMTFYVIFSGRCNLECTFCTIYKEVEPILTAEQMFRIVREAKELSGKGFNISLSGGEPMIFKPLYDTLALAHELGVNFGFTTNGLGLTKGNCERLLSHDPFNINVSLESVDAKVNESLRPMKDGTRRTLEGIDNLIAEKDRTNSRVSIIVKATIMEQNYRGLPDLVRHFGKK
jgi:MoaA/NifB/PqqE/SkfB family radical SAM enzyme